MELRLFDPIRRKKVRVGELSGDKFYKLVMGYHFDKDRKAYPLLESVFQELKKRNVKTVLLWEQEKDNALYSLLSDWEDFAKTAVAKDNREYRYLPIVYMRESEESLK